MDHVAAFTEELLRTGCMLSDLGAELIDSISPEAYPGEQPGAVVIEMITGTIRTALAGVEEEDMARATELIAGARDRVIEHLELALALSRRIHEGGAEGTRKGHG